jgi:hypothetical protein
MMFWIVALAIAAVSLLVFLLLRPFTKRVTYKGVATVIGTAVIFAPIVAMSLLITSGVLLLGAGLLYLLYGTLPQWMLVALAVLASWSFMVWFITRKP